MPTNGTPGLVLTDRQKPGRKPVRVTALMKYLESTSIPTAKGAAEAVYGGDTKRNRARASYLVQYCKNHGLVSKELLLSRDGLKGPNSSPQLDLTRSYETVAPVRNFNGNGTRPLDIEFPTIVSNDPKIKTIVPVTDGIIMFDSCNMLGLSRRELLLQGDIKSDRVGRTSFGLNCFLVKTGSGNILIDAGVGRDIRDEPSYMKVFGTRTSKLHRNLVNQGMRYREIDIVILTHLHFDHYGGSVRLNSLGEWGPTFPNAKYLVQRCAWEDFERTLNEEKGHRITRPSDPMMSYGNTFRRVLTYSGQLQLLDGDTQIIPGVRCEVTGGHTKGDQIVTVSQGSTKMLFPGDIIPSHYHTNPHRISLRDRSPGETFERKTDLLRRADKEGFAIAFYHSLGGIQAGYLEPVNSVGYEKPRIKVILRRD